jgi:hypothetical protein
MEERHKQYVKYYESRIKKFENSKLYSRSYETEKALYDAISTASDLNDFKTKLEKGNLAVKNAIALTKDKVIAFKELYLKLKEFIRAQSSEEILEKIDEAKTDQDVVNIVTDIDQKNSVKISVDLFTDGFYSDFKVLEDLEVWENAEVPDEWKTEIKETIQKDIADGWKQWKEDILPNNRNWDPNWNFNYELIWEERHRRLIPFPDEIVKKRVEQHKNYRGIQ